MGDFQRGNGLLARHRRKRVKELVEAVIPLEVIDQIPERHSCSDEHGRAAEDLRVAMDHGHVGRHRHLRSDFTTA